MTKNEFKTILSTLMVVKRESKGKNKNLKNYDASGRKRTIQTQKIVENIANCLNPISKGSRNMFARPPDICFYIVNKLVKQDVKMTKIWVKFIPKSLT